MADGVRSQVYNYDTHGRSGLFRLQFEKDSPRSRVFNIRFAPGSEWTDVGQITFCVFVFAFSSCRFLPGSTTVIFMSMMNAMYYAELFFLLFFWGGGVVGGGEGEDTNSKVL